MPLGRPDHVDAVLALDLATHCGWAVLSLRDGARWGSGTWDLTPRKGRKRPPREADGPGARYRGLVHHLDEVYTTLPATVAGGPSWQLAAVAVERITRLPKTAAQAAHVYGGLLAHLQVWVEDAELPLWEVNLREVKACAGYGGADKGYMLRRAREVWGPDISGEDEADALWVARAALTAQGLL
jgi:Holliday junction resolvasome RuvABC endonuclease subunit